MDIVKVVVLGVIISLISLFLKQVKPEYALLSVIVGSVILIIYILNYVSSIFNFFENIIERTGISKELLVAMLKIIGIGYLVEFSAGICRDSGNSSIADKVVLAGKLIIFMVSLPIINNFFNMILSML